MEAAAEIARASARSWLSPLLETACDRLEFVLRSLFDLAVERNRAHNSNCKSFGEHSSSAPSQLFNGLF